MIANVTLTKIIYYRKISQLSTKLNNPNMKKSYPSKGKKWFSIPERIQQGKYILLF